MNTQTSILVDAQAAGALFEDAIARATAGQQRLAERLIEDAGGEGEIHIFSPGIPGERPAQVGAILQPQGTHRVVQVKVIPHLPTTVLIQSSLLGDKSEVLRFDVSVESEYQKAVACLIKARQPDRHAGLKGALLWRFENSDFGRKVMRVLQALARK